MSDFTFSCPACGQHIRCDESSAGAAVKCPRCTADIVVPQSSNAASVQSGATVPQACPGCGAALVDGARICTNCGYDVQTGQRLTTHSAATRATGGRRPVLGLYALAGVVVVALGILVLVRLNSGPGRPPAPPAIPSHGAGSIPNLINIWFHTTIIARNIRTSAPVSVYDGAAVRNRIFQTTSLPAITQALDLFIRQMQDLVAHGYLDARELEYLRDPLDKAISLARGEGTAATMSERARRRAISQWVEQVPKRVELLFKMYGVDPRAIKRPKM